MKSNKLQGRQYDHASGLAIGLFILMCFSNSLFRVEAATVVGPMSYLSQSDSPFIGPPGSPFIAPDLGVTFYLEDFEDMLFTPGWMINTPTFLCNASNCLADSVDADDGVIDGSGSLGGSLCFGLVCFGSTMSTTIVFDSKILGGYPTHVGVVWTDGLNFGGTLGPFNVSFEWLDVTGKTLGVKTVINPGDASSSGETGEDFFVGMVDRGGISRLRITGSGAINYIEIDHLQYGISSILSSDLVIDFGSIGLWARMNDLIWQKLNNSSPDKVVVGDVDGNGVDDVIADFGSTFGGIFIKRNLGAWTKLHNAFPRLMAVGDLDNNGKDDVVIDFGGIGLWARMNDTNWLKLNNTSPTQLVVGDMDGNGADDVIAVFSSGIFVKRNLGGWRQLHNFTPELMTVGDLDGNGKADLVIDFGGIALWARMNDSSWLKLNNTSPDLITTGDLDGNGSDDVIATFNGIGLWQKLNLGGWSQLNPNAPDEVITADMDGSGQDDIIAKFGSTIGGIFVRRNQGAWSKLHNFNPDSLAVGNLDGQ